MESFASGRRGPDCIGQGMMSGMDDKQPYRIEIDPQRWQFDCSSTQTILLAALAAGLRMPHSCRNGTCRACIARLLEGRIAYRIEWPGLSREEKDEGWILPCVACPRSDLLIAAPSTAAVDKHVHSLRTPPPSD
jgi:ferredoxin